ncbi:MAG: tetratricopeptide repeat protein [Neisseria sp.]|uniref:SEL1-like repeat protein n=1 Tax=Neisseria sp. TaxID=192066 RepID=UPI0026DC00AE|nr:tetratricopeptide repeat protein [Neisseria sp.]MDO4641342.1 tetratricopeptide repeat protein [Neisseria sp.]
MQATDDLVFRQALACLHKTPPAYEQALPLLEQSALSGNGEAADRLGNCYLYGFGTSANRIQATYWFKQAADLGHHNGSFHLSMLREQNGIPFCEILPVYTQLAQEGFLPAQTRLMDYYAEHNPAQALYWAKQSAEQHSSPKALFFLAQHHQNSSHPDKAAAYQYYRQAAAQGYAPAHWQIGLQYLRGEGVQPNSEQALHHLKIAAHSGIPAAQTEYARQLLANSHNSAHTQEALQWYRTAAAKDDSEAHMALAQLYLIGQYLPHDLQAVRRHADAAAGANHPRALRLLGDIYQYGLGINASEKTAADYYLRAAQAGDIAAYLKLADTPFAATDLTLQTRFQQTEHTYQTAFARQYGLECRQNYSEALTLYLRAAEQGHPKAQACLGMMYQNGHGTPIDSKQAAHWLTQAALQGDPDAAYNLANLLYHGHGVPQDTKTACLWLSIAITTGHTAAKALRCLLYEWRNNPQANQ